MKFQTSIVALLLTQIVMAQVFPEPALRLLGIKTEFVQSSSVAFFAGKEHRSVRNEELLQYDKDGFVTSQKSATKNSTFYDEFDFENRFTYNPDHSLSERRYTSPRENYAERYTYEATRLQNIQVSDLDGTLRYTVTNTYDKDTGLLVEQLFVGSGLVLSAPAEPKRKTYIYNTSKQLVEITITVSNINIEKQQFSYFKSGNLETQRIFRQSVRSGLLEVQIIQTFDAKTGWILTTEDHTVGFNRPCSVDQLGKELFPYEEYRYKLDAKGNWIQRTTVSHYCNFDNKQPYRTETSWAITRTLTYY
jgi:hypothetical protein